MAKFTIDELGKTFIGKFVTIQDGKIEISIYVTKISYSPDSVWLGYHQFEPKGVGELMLSKLQVVELTYDIDGSVHFPFNYKVLDEDQQETYGLLYL